MKSILDKNNKKGSIEDSIFIVVLLFITALVFLFAYVINSTISTAAIPAFENVSAGSSIGFTTVNSIFDNTINYVYLAVFFGLIISLVITSFLTPTHPIFYIFAVIIFIALMIVSVALSNMYEAITANPTFSSAVAHMPIMDYIMLHLPMIAIVIGIIAAIIVFSRAGGPQGGGGFTETQ